MRIGLILALGLLAAAAVGYLVFPPEGTSPTAVPAADEGESPTEVPTLAGAGTRAVGGDAQGGLDPSRLLAELRALDPEAAGRRLEQVGTGRTGANVPYDRALVAYLLEALRSGDRAAVQGATFLLARIRPLPYAEVQPLLAEEEGRLRMAAISILSMWARAGESYADPGWLEAFRDPDPKIARFAWAVVCGGVPYSSVLADFCEAKMATEEAAAWFGPGRALAGMGPEGLQRLMKLLDRKDPELDYEILRALRFARPGDLEPFYPRLTPWILGEDADVAAIALAALQQQGDALAPLMPVLIKAWKSEAFGVRWELVGLFERLGPKAAGAADVLLAALDEDTDDRIVTAAMGLLGGMRALPERVLPRLRTALDEGGDGPAARALGAYGAAAVPYLRSALESPDENVRYFALMGVKALGASSKELRELVLPLIGVDDGELAAKAAEAAGSMGEAAAEAVPLLWQRLRDGTLKTAQLAEIYGGIGPTAGAYLLTRLGGEAEERASALRVLASYRYGTAFALDALDTALLSKVATDRRLAAVAVSAAANPPPPKNDAELEASLDFVAPAPLRRRVAALLRPLRDDSDRVTAQVVRGVLAQLARMEALEVGRQAER